MSTILIWCVTFVMYLLFAGTISTNELVTAVILASLATGWAVLIRASSPRRFAYSREFLPPIARACASLLPATARIGALLFRIAAVGGTPGRSHLTDFHYGRRNDPMQRARRAVAVLLASLAPDRFVIDIDRSRRQVFIHNLSRRDHAPDSRWLE